MVVNRERPVLLVVGLGGIQIKIVASLFISWLFIFTMEKNIDMQNGNIFRQKNEIKQIIALLILNE